jgi:hypothetical protein
MDSVADTWYKAICYGSGVDTTRRNANPAQKEMMM